MIATSSGALGTYYKFLQKKEYLKIQVKFLPEKNNASAPTPIVYNLLFTLDIQTTALSETLNIPQIP